MEINYSKAETLKLIEEYYQRLEGRQVKAKITASKGTAGYYETESCITSISVVEKMEIGGMQKEVTISLSEEELNRNLNALFELYNFRLISLSLNDGIDSRCEGYGMMEHQVKSAYFRGITVNVDRLPNKELKKVNL